MSTYPFGPQSKITFAEARQIAPLTPLVIVLCLVAALIAAAFYWDVVWDMVASVVPLALEVAEESLETLFEMIGLGSIAPIATAYTGFVLILVIFYILLRKGITWNRSLKRSSAIYRGVYGALYQQWVDNKRQVTQGWWESLDWMQKIAAVTAFLLIGIPLALAISVALGNLVAMLL